MRSHLTLRAAIIATLLFAPSASADCPGSSVPPEAIVALANASTVAALDRAVDRFGAAHPAIRALYRRRRLALNPTKAEELRYLTSLPRTESDLSRVYELTYARDVCELPAVSETVYGMYQTAVRLVRSHGRFHRRFIELCLLTDGEVGEAAWPEFDLLLTQDSDRTVTALRTLPLRARTSICGGKDPRDLSLKDAVNACASGL